MCTYSEQRPPVYNAEDYSLYLRKYCKFTGEYKENFAQFPCHIFTRKMYADEHRIQITNFVLFFKFTYKLKIKDIFRQIYVQENWDGIGCKVLQYLTFNPFSFQITKRLKNYFSYIRLQENNFFIFRPAAVPSVESGDQQQSS